MNVAFLGLGRMGAAMARHVLDAGHELRVWNRTPDKAAGLVDAGATAAVSPAEAARGAEIVVAMLADPDAVRQVLLGPDGAADGAAAGTLVIDASTIGPAAAKEVGTALRGRSLRYVDAPVLGSVHQRGKARSPSSPAAPRPTTPTRSRCSGCGAIRRRYGASAVSAVRARSSWSST